MTVWKEKITSKEELEEILNSIVIDDWCDYPAKEPNQTDEEYMKQYKQYLRKLQMKIVLADYDICIEDDGE